MFESIIKYLEKVPAVKSPIGVGFHEEGLWWIKFRIDINHELAWSVVQELGCVINYISITEKLPTVFYPISPAPYMNGGPNDFLSWVIENEDKSFQPDTLKQWLEGRLPNPLDDMEQWNLGE